VKHEDDFHERQHACSPGLPALAGSPPVAARFDMVFSTGTLAVEAFVDAALPGSVFAGVVPAPDGLLYGLTYDGGANGDGAIYSNNRSPTPASTLRSQIAKR